jgi:hypothetical protein
MPAKMTNWVFKTWVSLEPRAVLLNPASIPWPGLHEVV